MFTNAGPEIGVASTKAFTTQLAALMLLALSFAKSRGLNPKLRGRIVNALRLLPETISESLAQKDQIAAIALVLQVKTMHFSWVGEFSIRLQKKAP
jgi:glucosamine--fructose-6-phosphate aminotransferase (isomerizing)